MTKLEEKAFDWADKYCDCKEGEDCIAGPLMKGYVVGSMAEREANVRLVLDLLFALRAIKGTPTMRDLVKLARRIREAK